MAKKAVFWITSEGLSCQKSWGKYLVPNSTSSFFSIYLIPKLFTSFFHIYVYPFPCLSPCLSLFLPPSILSCLSIYPSIHSSTSLHFSLTHIPANSLSLKISLIVSFPHLQGQPTWMEFHSPYPSSPHGLK